MIRDTNREYILRSPQGHLRGGSVLDVMVSQIDHLAEVPRCPTSNSASSHGYKVNVFPPCGFDLDDDHTAVVGVVGDRLVQRLNDVVLYAGMFEKVKQTRSLGQRRPC